jgi:aryl-alcohol dehydrogenase-like predicted oxidoreductase
LAEAQRSVETSLAQLGVDCIDLLMMHDCEVGGFVPDEMAAFSDRLRREGKIRAFGIATSIEAVLGITGHDYDFVQCVQFPNNLVTQNLRRLPAPKRFGIITHSPFRSFDRAHDAERRNWSEALRAAGFDAGDKSVLAALQLAWALHDNADGIVLCSAFDPKHLAENIAVAERGGFAADLLSQLSEGEPKEAASARSGPRPGAGMPRSA